MKIGYMTDGGRRRPTNEDAVKVMEDVSFYMLADGVGGNRSGEIASQSALDALEKFIRQIRKSVYHQAIGVKAAVQRNGYDACFCVYQGRRDVCSECWRQQGLSDSRRTDPADH